MEPTLASLIGILSLEPQADTDKTLHFQGRNVHMEWPRLYGGQVLAQALMAASYTVAEDRQAHSLHAYFLRPGDPNSEVDYAVDKARDGGSFSARQVVVSQQDKPILVSSLSFQQPEQGADHLPEMPEAPAPEALISERERFIRDGLTEESNFVTGGTSFDFRAVNPINYSQPESREGHFQVWMKATSKLPDHVALHQALLLYVSDCYMIDAALLPHAFDYHDPSFVCASLDHSLWFHDAFRMDEWLLHDVQVLRTGRNRGLSLGKYFTREGRLVATVTQECLMRMTQTS